MNHKRFLHLMTLTLMLGLILAACAPQPAATPEINLPTTTATEPLPTEAPTAAPTATNPPAPTDEPAAEPIVLVDGLDRTVTLESPARRIVALAPSLTESLFAIGAGDQVVARDEFSNYPPEAADLPAIGGVFSDFNYEAIVELEPDLVLASGLNTAEQVQTMEDLGLTVFLVEDPTTLEEMYTSLEVLAELTGHEDAATELVADLKARVAAVEEVIAAVEERPLVFYELDSTDPSAPYTAGSGTFIDTLIEMAGGENLAADLEGQYPQISIEELLVRDPDIILLGDAAYGATPEAVAERPGWGALSAIQIDQIYPVNDDPVSRPGPRLVDGLEELAQLIHPEAFQ